MKIIKTHAATGSAGNGFGAHAACWGVADRSDIRVFRETGLWKAIVNHCDRREKFVATSRKELELKLAGIGANA
ncbi:hypothetical protein UFOVP1304_54 [uncultured Caudovirales phage]|uniref:Uncharacterized protein n=1 Tax=uncultured Caudovirales phage TaxID=2100421 RepID=A0A6J5RI67_9CAUD|nr:hypothetical protein UFOVP1304_54 [uncultured Caudovirales phage]